MSRESRCKERSCNEPVITVDSGGQTITSKYCKRHACKVGWGCVKHRSKESRKYCKKHTTCGDHNCTAEGHGLYNMTSPWFCTRHKCTSRDCSNQKQMTSEFCSVHQPPVPPKCSVQRCPQPALRSPFCHNHKCADATCRELQTANGRCGRHQICSARDCNTVSVWNNVEHRAERYCSRHAKCRVPACTVTVDTRGGGYCQSHACELPGCGEKKYQWARQSRWCRKHTCTTEGCDRPIPNQEAPTDEDGIYLFLHCDIHTCSEVGCPKPALCSLGPCQQHACPHLSCTKAFSSGHEFCHSHECVAAGCLRHRGLDIPYCLEIHACAEPRCPKSRGDEQFPDLCPQHGHNRSYVAGVEQERRRQEEQAHARAAEEEARVRAEAARVQAEEAARARAETARVQAEEAARVQAEEAARAQAERARQAEEEARRWRRQRRDDERGYGYGRYYD